MDRAEPRAARRREQRRRVVIAALTGALCIGAVTAVVALSSRSHRGSPPAATTAVASSPPATTTTPPANPPPARAQFGVNVNRLFNDGTYTPRQIDQQLGALRATGATVARSDALWEATEPAAPVGGVHHYHWAFDDAIATALAEHGLRWLAIIDYSAPWAQSVAGVDHSPPRSAGDYAAYAGALAARYGAGGSFWRAHPELPADPVGTYEIWNEPDNPTFWSPTPDAGRYASLYETARDAILAVDPTAAVIVGGLTHVAAFVPAMIAARPDLRGHIDGIGLHPYGADPAAVLANVAQARQSLSSAGLGGVALYITELGWTTHPPSNPNFLPESKRPGYIERTLAALGGVRCGLAATVLYTWVTPQRDRANGQDWFGIHGPDGARTPDSDAFAQGLRRASRSASRPCP
jgi:hypothetical protein